MPGRVAIRIWAPCAPSRKRIQAWRDAGADPDEKPRGGYKLISVFAQDQVPSFPHRPSRFLSPRRRAPRSQATATRALPRLVELASEINYTVNVTDAGAADGTL